MKSISLFLRLIRWPNLVFIFLTQFLFEYSVVRPIAAQAGITPALQATGFLLLGLAFVLVAAAGYIINDYYDLAIDLVNKPDKVFITRGMGKGVAMAWYILMNIAALACAWYVNRHVPGNCAFLTVTVCIIALYFYSASLKKKFLAGNVLVAAVTASSVMVLGCVESSVASLPAQPAQNICLLTALYTGFAFVISLIREVIKDMEDVEGDRQFGCRTMPIVWGIRGSSLFAAGWIILLILVLLFTQAWLLRHGHWLLPAYMLLLIILPLIIIFKKLFEAGSAQDYHKLSSGIKLVMLAGILSMLLVSFSGVAA